MPSKLQVRRVRVWTVEAGVWAILALSYMLGFGPSLISANDTVAVIAGFALAPLFIIWLFSLAIRAP